MIDRPVPQQLTAPVGMNAKEEETELKEAYPTMTEGTLREVSDELRNQYAYAIWAAAYWNEQKRLITNRIRRELGTAQVVTANGVPFAARAVYERSGYTVEATEIDIIKPVRKQP